MILIFIKLFYYYIFLFVLIYKYIYSQIQYFLQFVKSVYSELPKNLPKIFEPRPPLRVKDLSEVNIEVLLKETFTITAIQSEKKAADGTVVTVSKYELFKRKKIKKIE